MTGATVSPASALFSGGDAGHTVDGSDARRSVMAVVLVVAVVLGLGASRAMWPGDDDH